MISCTSFGDSRVNPFLGMQNLNLYENEFVTYNGCGSIRLQMCSYIPCRNYINKKRLKLKVLSVFLKIYFTFDKNFNTLTPVLRTLRIGAMLIFTLGFISLSEPKSPRLILVVLVFSGLKNRLRMATALSGRL